jgi:hypothetical protein
MSLNALDLERDVQHPGFSLSFTISQFLLVWAKIYLISPISVIQTTDIPHNSPTSLTHFSP